MYDHSVNDVKTSGVAAFILAGGKSSRMGRDKAFLQLGGETLLCHALKLAGSVAPRVRIVGDAEKFAAFGPVVEDVYRDRGPLGGIHAALANTAADLNLMLAVDLPFVESRFLEFLLSEARQTSAIVTVPRADKGLQPLCAVYRQTFAEVAEQSLREGKNKIDGLFAKVETRVIDEEQLVRAGFSIKMFRNLNTPKEWEKARHDFSQVP